MAQVAALRSSSRISDFGVGLRGALLRPRIGHRHGFFPRGLRYVLEVSIFQLINSPPWSCFTSAAGPRVPTRVRFLARVRPVRVQALRHRLHRLPLGLPREAQLLRVSREGIGLKARPRRSSGGSSAPTRATTTATGGRRAAAGSTASSRSAPSRSSRGPWLFRRFGAR